MLEKEENESRKKESNARQSKLLIENKREIEQFAYNISTSVNVLKSLLFNTQIELEELIHLKSLFFENIGFINMGVIEQISNLAQEQIDTFSTEDYLNYDLEIGQLMRADMFLRPVIDFYRTKLSRENFEKMKAQWLKSKGIPAEGQPSSL